MTSQIVSVTGTRSVHDDDIASLRRSLQMSDLPYVDFSAQRELHQALARWPLLSELADAAAWGTQ